MEELSRNKPLVLASGPLEFEVEKLGRIRIEGAFLENEIDEIQFFVFNQDLMELHARL